MKGGRGKIRNRRIKMGRGQLIHKMSCLQKPAYLDIPANPQVKGAPEPGAMRRPLAGCCPDWMLQKAGASNWGDEGPAEVVAKPGH